MKYTNIISDFTWSYSRIGQFEMCPYAFLLNYIKHTNKKRLFFSDYGSFVHKLIEEYLNGKIKREDLTAEYLARFRIEVLGEVPNKEIFKSYFEQGFNYFNNMNFPYSNPLHVEHKVNFEIDSIPFVGVIDMVAEDDGKVIILDNKSRSLKERTHRKKPTKSDEELDKYLRQLYLYSVPIVNEFGKYPERLEFNCFRSGNIISEPFNVDSFEKAKSWAKDSISEIEENDDWSPKIDYWKCRYLCDMNHECVYFAMSKGG